MNLKFLSFLALIVFSSTASACPNCAGSDNAADKYTIYVLAVFILLTYIPFYIIFKTAAKKKQDASEE